MLEKVKFTTLCFIDKKVCNSDTNNKRGETKINCPNSNPKLKENRGNKILISLPNNDFKYPENPKP